MTTVSMTRHATSKEMTFEERDDDRTLQFVALASLFFFCSHYIVIPNCNGQYCLGRSDSIFGTFYRDSLCALKFQTFITSLLIGIKVSY